MSAVEGCYFQVWYGSKVLELKPGMTAVQVATKEELPDVIRSVMEAVKFAELDIQIEDVAERGTAELRLKAKPRLISQSFFNRVCHVKSFFTSLPGSWFFPRSHSAA